jgi:hypothetical protein
VQTPADLVAALFELSARMQHRQRDLGCGTAHVRVDVGGDTAAIVSYGKRAIFVDDDIDQRAKTGHGLVDRVVDHLVDQVVQTGRAGRADVHGRALLHRLKALEHADIRGAIAARVAVLGQIVAVHKPSAPLRAAQAHRRRAFARTGAGGTSPQKSGHAAPIAYRPARPPGYAQR